MGSFFEEYISDIKSNNLIDCKILFSFTYITKFTEIKKSTKDVEIQAYKDGAELRVIASKKIPESLVRDLKTNERSSMNFLIGYINDFLPFINQNILQRKYNTAQVLSKPLAIQDIKFISIADLKNNDKFLISWPIGFDDFPFKNDIQKYNYTYIKDLIDAITYYLYADYDVSMIKVITSLENAFKQYKIDKKIKNKPTKPKRQSFLNKIYKLIRRQKNNITFKDRIDYVVDREELKHNILTIYKKVRCKIVHNDLRLEQKHDMICHKGIGTLFYIYKGYLCNSQELSHYIFEIETQFNMLLQFFRGMKTEHFMSVGEKDGPILKPGKDFDDLMFNSIKIKDSEINKL